MRALRVHVATNHAATPCAHARPRAAHWPVAPVDRPRLLQLLRGTGKPQESGRVPGSGACSLLASHSPTEPDTPDQLDAPPYIGSTMAPSTACAPSLS